MLFAIVPHSLWYKPEPSGGKHTMEDWGALQGSSGLESVQGQAGA